MSFGEAGRDDAAIVPRNIQNTTKNREKPALAAFRRRHA
jgi:hypothetical protein